MTTEDSNRVHPAVRAWTRRMDTQPDSIEARQGADNTHHTLSWTLEADEFGKGELELPAYPPSHLSTQLPRIRVRGGEVTIRLPVFSDNCLSPTVFVSSGFGKRAPERVNWDRRKGATGGAYADTHIASAPLHR